MKKNQSNQSRRRTIKKRNNPFQHRVNHALNQLSYKNYRQIKYMKDNGWIK